MQSGYKNMLKHGYEQYLTRLGADNLKPNTDYLTYDFDFLNGHKWYGLGEWMVCCDLRELTNLLNRWRQLLIAWQAWNNVISTLDNDTAWELRLEFLESKVHECLLKPSSIRDTFTSVSTNAFHQVRLSIDHLYKDNLQGDPTAENPTPSHLSRKKKEKRLSRLASFWTESEAFLKARDNINSVGYIRATSDYRNLNSHTIGPRLGFGYTRTVTRDVLPLEKLVQASDETFQVIAVSGAMTVSYGFGGMPPLDLENARIANLEQFELACVCYSEYRQLLELAVSKIPIVEAF